MFPEATLFVAGWRQHGFHQQTEVILENATD